jgi:hypothetical protein
MVDHRAGRGVLEQPEAVAVVAVSGNPNRLLIAFFSVIHIFGTIAKYIFFFPVSL